MSIKSTLAFAYEYQAGLFRGALTFIDNTLVYLYDKTPRRGPLFVGWNVLFNCNAKCSFCDTHELHKQLQREMTTEEALDVVKQLGEAGTWHLSLTGGETLLRQDLPEIIKAAKHYGMYVNVNTNGALLAKKAQRLVDSGVDSIISLDSDQAETHDNAREIPKLSESALKGIETIKQIRQQRKTPQITLRKVISKQNFERIDEYIQQFEPLVDKIVIQPIHDGVAVPKFKAKNNLNLFNIKQQDVYQFETKDRGRYVKNFNALYEKYSWLNTAFIREFEHFIFDKDELWERYKCYAGYYYLVVDPSLKVFPCTFFVKELGSLRDNKLMTLWKSPAIKEWRETVKNKKNTCLCWCGIAEVNAVLTNKLESRWLKLFAKNNKS